MRRKIEKYLSRKQGVDEANIRYLDDGRFDFMGDLAGVLQAVRGKESNQRGRGRVDKRKKKETNGNNDKNCKDKHDIDNKVTSDQSKNLYDKENISNSSKNVQGKGKSNNGRSFGANLTQTPSRANFEKDSVLQPLSISDVGFISPNFMMSVTPKEFRSGYKSSVQKEAFSTDLLSPNARGNFKKLFSPDLSMGGMTPLSISRDDFVKTPFSGGEPLRLFSPRNSAFKSDLNKTLFPTVPLSGKKRKLDFGDSSSKMQSGDAIFREVAVSPILQNPKARKTYAKRRNFFQDIESIEGEASSDDYNLSKESNRSIGIFPLTASMEATPSRRTPTHLPIPTPSVAGSRETRSLSMSSMKKGEPASTFKQQLLPISSSDIFSPKGTKEDFANEISIDYGSSPADLGRSVQTEN
jgi:hypothetical protein